MVGTSEGTPVRRWPYRLAPIAALGLYNLVVFNRYFPLSEGWWETYGYLYNAGLRPYRDFELAFTPLFTIVNAALLRVVGDSAFALRLLGVGVFLAGAFLLQLLLEEFVSARSAAVATALSCFLVCGEPQFIAKDYHFYQLLLVVAALLLHVRLASREGLQLRQRLAGTVLVAVLACLVFFLKQNVGGLLLVSVAVTLPIVERERPFLRIAAFGFGVALALIALLPIVTPSDWRELLLANDAKGGIGTVLLRVWREPPNRAALLEALRLCVVLTVVRWAIAPPSQWRGVWRLSAPSPAVRGAAYLVVLVLVAAGGNYIRGVFNTWVVPATIALIVLGIVEVGRSLLDRARPVDPRIAVIAIPALALAYANTTTAIFDFNGMHVPIALAVAWLLGRLENAVSLRYWAVGALAFLIIVPEVVAQKIRLPYAWWGMRQASIGKATEEPAYPALKGIRVGPEERDTFHAIKQAVETYSRSDRDVLFYDLPLFYWLHHKRPPARTVVQWFDVVGSRQFRADLDAWRQQPPRLVVALDPPPVTFEGHRALKGTARLPQEEFWEWMDGEVASGKYLLLRNIILPKSAAGEDANVTQKVLLASPDALDARAAEKTLAVHRVTVLATARKAEGANPGGKPGETLRRGDVATLGGVMRDVRAASAQLGVARGWPRDWYSVNIYLRVDALAASPR